MARVLIKKRPILIMDEAVSSLDEKTDRILQSIIRKKLKGTTIINVAVKITNILDYDEILVFDKGEIIERGNSKQLFRKRGVFYDMVTENRELNLLS